jgi:hypothetical protein
MTARQNPFPSLAGQGMISLDVETFDPGLKDEGPGWHKDGFIAGVAVGTEAGHRGYYPVAHQPGGNLDREKVLAWLRAELSDPKVPKVFANAIYDLGFLSAAGVEVRGPIYDIQIAEPLIDETRPSYSLEALAQHYFGEGKVEDVLGPWVVSHLKDGAGRKFNSKNWKGAIWRAPAEIVGPYAVSDIDLPLRIFARQKAELERLNLWPLFEMEISLIPMLLAMRQRGVAVDIPAAEKLYRGMGRRQAGLYGQIRDASGLEFAPWNAGDLGRVFDALEIPYERTAIAGRPSITKEFLEHHPHEMARARASSGGWTSSARLSSAAPSSKALITAGFILRSISCVRTASARSRGAFPPRSPICSRSPRAGRMARRSGLYSFPTPAMSGHASIGIRLSTG